MSWTTGRPPIPKALMRRVLERDGHACYIAGPGCTGRATQVDHLVPWSEGGTDDPANLRAVCPTCHGRKTAAEAARGRARARASATRAQAQHPGICIG